MLADRASPLTSRSAGGLVAEGPSSPIIVTTGWDAIDRALAPVSPRDLDSDALAHVGMGGLQRGAVHEWLCGDHVPSSTACHRWLPSHSLLIHLAWRAIEANDSADASGLIIWIGRRVWPQARALIFTAEMRGRSLGETSWILDFGFWNDKVLNHGWDMPASGPFTSFSIPLRGESPAPGIPNPKSEIQHSLLSRSLFIDPPDEASRLWAIDLALRSPASTAVIADGSGLKMAESRRLQLAAERGRALALLARPSWEGAELSAAATRWRVHRTPSPSSAPRWIVELLRCKQLQGRSGLQVSGAVGGCGGMGGGAGTWEVEYGSPGCVHLVADVVDQSGSPPAQTRINARSLA